ncbi:alpha-amylase family glycosyl hydrolase [Paenibacillus harenae]|uniref:alpha-amylase family glycosyl hydrolase n=1 Tax=Paenibacillus harenae TaxID=306543 RepID=UPI0027935457|nr:alpha-amylase family glycosyl hydrolase [Paenibacillus harenae]MDQ0063143.1 glycosidase [Paenibacillus harenae]
MRKVWRREKGLRLAAAFLLTIVLMATGCSNDPSETANPATVPPAQVEHAVDEQPGTVFYEIFVRSFYDTNDDGIGDLNGVTAKLDYLQELGVGGIWLMPINASPSYHGYDTTDYYAINSDYGTLDDLKNLIAEAHKRDIKVIMDLVVNHTSSEHPWFKEALTDPASPYRNWYQIVPKDEKVKADGAVGGNPWHESGEDKYLGVFWGGMPDLNFDEPNVREEMAKIGRYWLEQGVDGFRLDAAKHIYGDFSSTMSSPEIQAANQLWWQHFRSGLNEVNADAYLIGEVWDSISVIAPYFDKAFNSAFHFDLAGRMLGAVANERDADFGFSLARAYSIYEKSSGGTFVDAPFLSNHDQNRTMSVLNGNISQAKMAAAILLTLPGNPYIYYGEELGMKGAKPDELIREPMLWYSDPKGGEGQTTWEASEHNAAADAVSVEEQEADEQSMLSHYRRLMKWRNEEASLRDGTIAEYALDSANTSLSLYIRVTKKERVLVVHNLSNESQSAKLASSERFGVFTTVAHQTDSNTKLSNDTLSIPAYSTVILK